MEARRHDAGDGVRLAVEAELSADDRAVGMVTSAPESIADDDDRIPADKERAADRKPLPQLRAHTE